MKEYSRKDDWKIITHIKAELVKRWVNVDKLKINCTRGAVEIEGLLDFTGTGRSAMDSIITIQNALKKFDTTLCAVSNVRAVKWKLLGWDRRGKLWNYHPTPQIRKINEAKGLK